MKKPLKKVLYVILAIVVAILSIGLVLAFLPTELKVNRKSITPETAAQLRQQLATPHHEFTTTDGATLFLRRWNPDSVETAKKDIAVLLLHGITAHSGAYNMAGVPLSKGGYTTFGLDYRGHGLSGGNRGDNPSKERWLADFTETIAYIKGFGFKRVVILGHSLGVASAMYTTMTAPNEVAGLVLLSGAKEGRKNVAGATPPPTLFEKAKIVASSIFRPSYPAVEYYRKGMSGNDDSLFNFRYTLRFVSMLNVKELQIPQTLNIPILVGVGDNDELFEIEEVKELYNEIPGNKKEFLVLKNATHAKIPTESWEQVVNWLNRNF